MSHRETTKPRAVSEKQIAANRANAARSTGPRTQEGKARSAQNARKHGFASATYSIPRAEGLEDLADLKADLLSVYHPVNAQELFAIDRIALAQHALLRVSRLEVGLFSCGINQAVDEDDMFLTQPKMELTMTQGLNYALADGFTRMVHESANVWKLFLRYQAQTERNYRRAIEDFERLKSQRGELPNEPICEPNPESFEQLNATPDEPVSNPPNPSAPPPSSFSNPPAAAPCGPTLNHPAAAPSGAPSRVLPVAVPAIDPAATMVVIPHGNECRPETDSQPA
jgi:hypothetical protein